MSRDRSRDIPRDPRRPRRSDPFVDRRSDTSSNSGDNFRVVLPTSGTQFFDQDAPENLSTDASDSEETNLNENDEKFDSEPISSTDHVPSKWLAFDVGEDDIALKKSKRSKDGVQMIEPRVGKDAKRFWISDKNKNSVVHGLLCPKIPGACEDAPPIFFSPLSAPHKPTTIGVLDGMGGAGAGPAEFELDGVSISTTEALLASRITRLAVVKSLVSETLLTRDGLKELISDRLQKTDSYVKLSEKTRIRGTMTKRLPTTLVISQIQDDATTNYTKINTWWAGDSRAFLVTPGDGLAMLTRDHVRVDDPLEQLRSDPPIENVVNRSIDFYLDEFSTTVKNPFVLLLATDGVFGYLPTPGFLELGILEALVNSRTNVAEHFADFCTSYAADDVSAAILIRGFSDDNDVTAKFSNRLKLLRERYSFLHTMTSDDANRNSEIERLWAIERPSYLRLSGVGDV